MILLDVCVPIHYKELLETWGYTVAFSDEYIPNTTKDNAVIQQAQELGAVLLSVDLDFANILDFPPSNYAGIIVLRMKNNDEKSIDAGLKEVLEKFYPEGLRGALVVINAKTYRIHR